MASVPVLGNPRVSTCTGPHANISQGGSTCTVSLLAGPALGFLGALVALVVVVGVVVWELSQWVVSIASPPHA